MDRKIFIAAVKTQLQQIMREKGLKAAPLARKAELNESAVRDILRDRSTNPGCLTLKAICDVSDTTLTRFFAPIEYGQSKADLLDLCLLLLEQEEEAFTALLEAVVQIWEAGAPSGDDS